LSTAPVELVHVRRSGLHEGTHYGSVVITAADGSVEFARGDVTTPMFPRSSNKPFQAVAMLAGGADLHGADLALAAASHSGEPMHVDRVFGMLDRAGLTEDDLGCPPALPLNETARRAALLAGGERRVFMNCSGKHAGMLTACVRNGWSTADYLDPAHPLQQGVVDAVARLCREEPAAVGIDGCGAPLFAVSLTALARGFGAAAAAAADTHEGRVTEAMRTHPAMVGGTGRDDTRLMQALPGLLAKGGAEGVHCAALADGRCVAIKIADGGDRARMPVLVTALRAMGVRPDSPQAADLLDEFAVGQVMGGGEPVGTVSVAPGVF
jgi:L-asparaginase II